MGHVVDIVGVFTDPAYSAFCETSPPQPLYRVRIEAKEVWAHTVQTIEADINFHPWLTKDKIIQKNASPSIVGVRTLQPTVSHLLAATTVTMVGVQKGATAEENPS